MKFHSSAIIQTEDPPRVWRMIEARLRDMTIEIERTGSQMTLSGLGPGTVSMNKDDVAVLTMEERADAVFIAVDGVFDGTYLGDQAAQEAEIRSKLERVFDAVQKQIDLEEMQSPIGRIAVGKEPAKEVLPFEVAATRAAAAPANLPAASSREVWNLEPAMLERARMNRVADVAPAHYRQLGFFAATIVVVAMMATGVGGVQRFLHRGGTASPRVKVQLPDTQLAPISSSANRPLLSIRETATNVTGDLVPVPSKSASRGSDRSVDPATWLSHWEKAMRTRDAAAQSSFYADRVDRYQGEAHMSKADVEQKKQAAIGRRKGLWTVKVEGAVIRERSKDDVEIQLVKHVIDQPAPAQISEQFVQTEIRLKRLKGAWKIVSEEDLAESPTPLDPRS